MSFSLKQFRQEMVRRDAALGRIETPTTYTATTFVINLLRGVFADKHFVDNWVVRPDSGTASQADRVRRVTAWTELTGTGTHGGPDYGDVDATGESLELLSYPPLLYDAAINRILHLRWHQHEMMYPAFGSNRIWLDETDWIDNDREIVTVKVRSGVGLARNPRFTRWGDISAGVLTPDHWSISGGTSSMVRTTTAGQFERGISPYALSVTYTGATAVVSQTIQWLTGVAADSLQGKTVTIYGRARSTAASSVRLRLVETLSDNTTVTTNTSYHAGNSQFAELSQQVTINANTVSMALSARVEQAGDVAQFSVIDLLYGTLTDTARRDINTAVALPKGRYRVLDNGAADLSIEFPRTYSWGQQIIVCSYRPWLPMTSRLSNDTDVTDAPLEKVVLGATAVLYEQLKEMSGAGSASAQFYAGLEQSLRQTFDEAARSQMKRHRGLLSPRPMRI